MRKIKEVVVVEGKTDTATLKQLFDVELHCKVDCEHSSDKK